jgi:cell division protein FtsI/penicillin-binding protein 2
VQVIKPQTAAEVSQMLENVYAQGTLADDIKIPGYRLAVKTGTAQVPDGHGGYKDNLFMTSLAGYAPADDPQYVVLTLFNEPKTNTDVVGQPLGLQEGDDPGADALPGDALGLGHPAAARDTMTTP